MKHVIQIIVADLFTNVLSCFSALIEMTPLCALSLKWNFCFSFVKRVNKNYILQGVFLIESKLVKDNVTLYVRVCSAPLYWTNEWKWILFVGFPQNLVKIRFSNWFNEHPVFSLILKLFGCFCLIFFFEFPFWKLMKN